MTSERIAEIEALCEAATPGPWETVSGLFGVFAGGKRIADIEDTDDCKFFVAARQIIPELLDALENKAAEVELWKTGADRERAKRLIEEDRAKEHHKDFMALVAKLEKTTKDLQEERERRYRISYNLEAVLKERRDE